MKKSRNAIFPGFLSGRRTVINGKDSKFCFTSGRSRTLDSFYAGNRRQARKDLIFRAFSACHRIPRGRGIVKERPEKSKKSPILHYQVFRNRKKREAAAPLKMLLQFSPFLPLSCPAAHDCINPSSWQGSCGPGWFLIPVAAFLLR